MKIKPRDTSSDPRCRRCGKKLSPFHYDSETLPKGEPYRGNMIEVSRRPDWTSSSRAERDHVSLWDGERFGYAGDNLFCSLGCGYRYARDQLRGRQPSQVRT